MLDQALLDILVCPKCYRSLHYAKAQQELHCQHDNLVFAIKDGIPNMLLEQARKLTDSIIDII